MVPGCSESDTCESSAEYTLANHNPVSLIHEKALKLHLSITWNLVDELGPAHNKIFKLKLCIRSSDCLQLEQFDECGSSIRSAKKLLAIKALDSSKLLNKKPGSTKMKKPLDAVLTALIANEPSSSVKSYSSQLTHLVGLFDVKIKFHCLRLTLPDISTIPSKPAPSPPQVVPPGLLGPPPNPLSHPFNRVQAPLSSSVFRVVAELVGKQYVGEGSSRSIAKQSACLSALKAFRRSILDLSTYKPDNNFEKLSFRQVKVQNPTWRLYVLAGLHFDRPVFSGTRKIVTQESGKLVRSYLCEGRLACVGNVLVEAKAFRVAYRLAIEQLLHRFQLDNIHEYVETLCEIPVESATVRLKPFKRCNRTSHAVKQFAIDRLQPSYALSLCPITRLEHYCRGRSFDHEPVYQLVDPHASSTNCKQTIGFAFRVTLTPTLFVDGPEAFSRGLAKRLAAEAALELVGMQRPVSPPPTSILKPSRQAVEQELDSQSTSVDDISQEQKLPPHQSRNSVAFSQNRDVYLIQGGVEARRKKLVTKRPIHLSGRRQRRDSSSCSNDLQHRRRQQSLHSIVIPPDKDDDSGNCTRPGCGGEKAKESVLGNDVSLQPSIGHWKPRRTRSLIRLPSTNKTELSTISQLRRFGLSASLSSLLLGGGDCCSGACPAHPTRSLSVNHLSATTSSTDRDSNVEKEDPIDQLKRLCSSNRSLVKCNFIDFQPPLASDRRQGHVKQQNSPTSSKESDHHRTLVVVSANGKNDTSHPDNSPPSPIVVEAGASSRDESRRRAASAALRQLSLDPLPR